MAKWKNKTPRGWDDEVTYEMLPGIYESETDTVLIGFKGDYTAHGSVSLVLHEYGHMVDEAYSIISDTVKFFKLHNSVKDKLPDYQARYHEELFAEGFAKYYLSEESRKRLKENLPEAFEFFEDLEETWYR